MRQNGRLALELRSGYSPSSRFSCGIVAALQNHRGQPLTDANGQVLKVGSTVVDSMFGEGIARGTVRGRCASVA